jgi:hypothetical protein
MMLTRRVAAAESRVTSKKSGETAGRRAKRRLAERPARRVEPLESFAAE